MFPLYITSHKVQEMINRIKMYVSQIYYSHPSLQNTEQSEIQVADALQSNVYVKHNLPLKLPTLYSSQQ